MANYLSLFVCSSRFLSRSLFVSQHFFFSRHILTISSSCRLGSDPFWKSVVWRWRAPRASASVLSVHVVISVSVFVVTESTEAKVFLRSRKKGNPSNWLSSRFFGMPFCEAKLGIPERCLLASSPSLLRFCGLCSLCMCAKTTSKIQCVIFKNIYDACSLGPCNIVLWRLLLSESRSVALW